MDNVPVRIINRNIRSITVAHIAAPMYLGREVTMVYATLHVIEDVDGNIPVVGISVPNGVLLNILFPTGVELLSGPLGIGGGNQPPIPLAAIHTPTGDSFLEDMVNMFNDVASSFLEFTRSFFPEADIANIYGVTVLENRADGIRVVKVVEPSLPRINELVDEDGGGNLVTIYADPETVIYMIKGLADVNASCLVTLFMEGKPDLTINCDRDDLAVINHKTDSIAMLSRSIILHGNVVPEDVETVHTKRLPENAIPLARVLIKPKIAKRIDRGGHVSLNEIVRRTLKSIAEKALTAGNSTTYI